jgi:hypothetical protein
VAVVLRACFLQAVGWGAPSVARHMGHSTEQFTKYQLHQLDGERSMTEVSLFITSSQNENLIMKIITSAIFYLFEASEKVQLILKGRGLWSDGVILTDCLHCCQSHSCSLNFC